MLLKRKTDCHKIEAEFGLCSFHAQNTINRNTQNMSFAHHTAGRVLLSTRSYETFQTSHTNTHSEAGVLAVFCVAVCRSSCVVRRRQSAQLRPVHASPREQSGHLRAVSCGPPDPHLPGPTSCAQTPQSTSHDQPDGIRRELAHSLSECSHVCRQTVSSYRGFHKRVNFKELFHNHHCGCLHLLSDTKTKQVRHDKIRGLVCLVDWDRERK